MLNRHVTELLQVYRAIFQDAFCAFPALQGELERDLDHLERLVATRGLHVLCVDLPAAGKHFDRCLSEGKFTVSSLPLTKRCPRSVMYPQFLRGLHELVFDKSGCLKEACDVESIVFLRQFYYCGKKADIDCHPALVLDSVEDFAKTDAILPEPSRFWNEEQDSETEIESLTGFGRSETYSSRLVGDHYDRLRSLLTNLDLVSGMLSTTLGNYIPSEWRFRHGPGAVSERKGAVNKYEFVNWSDRLESVYPIADFGYYNHAAWADSCKIRFNDRCSLLMEHLASSIDQPSRLVSVRKSLTGPRLIAAEPTENQWCQQNIWHYLRTRVSHSWIARFVHFGDQSMNQLMCRKGSVDNSLATLDLSSASDRVSCLFVECLMGANLPLLRALRATRTRSVNQDIHPGLPANIRLKKFSTMGSACTFPIETLGFLSVALASVLTVRGLDVTKKNLMSLEGEVAVFGDDIIVPSDSRALTVEALEVLDFKVNTAKSYWSGNFRESCGVDAFRGNNVTPAYWRSPTERGPESLASALDVRNNFYKKGFWHAAAYLASTLPEDLIPTVSVDSGAFGFASFLGTHLGRFWKRVNRGLQKEQVLVLGLTSRQKRTHSGSDTVLLQFFTEDPHPSDPWSGGTAQRPQLKVSLRWVDVEQLGS